MGKQLPWALCVELCEAILHANSCHLIKPRCPSWLISSWKLYTMTFPQPCWRWSEKEMRHMGEMAG